MCFLLNLKEPNSDLVPMSDRSQRLVTPVGSIQHPLLASLNTHSYRHIHRDTCTYTHQLNIFQRMGQWVENNMKSVFLLGLSFMNKTNVRKA